MTSDHPLPPIPSRPRDAHKGTFGSVLVIAGSEGMSGAASLAGRAALHGGAGLVTVAVPRCVAPIVAAAHPSYMTVPLPDADGKVAANAAAVLQSASTGKTAVAMGPGLGQSEAVRSVVHNVWADCSAPLVLDADGLNAFSDQPGQLRARNTDGARVCTPHPGEFSRLSGLSTTVVAADRVGLAEEFARQHHVVLVLKGSGTVITDGAQTVVNTTGNSGMATGGTGDVLTGLIASLLGQRMDAFSAARLGTYLHGLAGDLAAAELSEPFLTSSDLVDWLSAAWKAVSLED